jgi:transcriptional regulator with XRE-family HTH domain
MADGPRHVVKRRRLRAELRNARQEADLTQDQVAEAMEWSPSKIIRIEAGSVGVSANDMKELLRLYHITESRRVNELLTLAREARERLTTYRDAPPDSASSSTMRLPLQPSEDSSHSWFRVSSRRRITPGPSSRRSCPSHLRRRWRPWSRSACSVRRS